MSMNIHLRTKIDESIESRQLSENLFLLCLACLNEKITYSKSKQVELEKERRIIAQSALMCDVKKEDIACKIKTISPKDYPTLKKIKAISKICESNDFVYASGFIPERMIHYKTDEEMQADLLRKPVVKKVKKIDEDLQKLIDYIQNELLGASLTSQMVKDLKALESKEYTFSVILRTFYDYKKKMISAASERSFESSYHKFKYFLAIAKNELPNGLIRYNQLKQNEEIMQQSIKEHMNTEKYVHHFVPTERKKLSAESEKLWF